MEKLLRWFGVVKVARMVELRAAHEHEMRCERSDRAIQLEETRRIVESAQEFAKRAERESAEQVRVIGKLLEELAVARGA